MNLIFGMNFHSQKKLTMNELDIYIKKVNYYLYEEYFIDMRGNINNIAFNWYFESFSRNETFQLCAGKINKYIKQELNI